MFYKRVTLSTDLSAHSNGAVRSLFSMEEISMIQLNMLNSI